MTEFTDADLQGSRFRRVELQGSEFRTVDLSDTLFHGVALHRAVIRGAELLDVNISGEIERLIVNGVDVTDFVNAERRRQHPDLEVLHPTDPDGFRAAWELLERRWRDTVGRARELDPEQLHVSVHGEWSFVETLRHLAFATDSWLCRAIQGDPSPWDPLDLPWDEMPDLPGVPRDREVRPSLDEALALRQDRQARVRAYLATLTPEQLAGDTEPMPGPGWPSDRSFPVAECLKIILNEEFEHRLYAERDLAALPPS